MVVLVLSKLIFEEIIVYIGSVRCGHRNNGIIHWLFYLQQLFIEHLLCLSLNVGQIHSKALKINNLIQNLLEYL